jgi:hypothetical protein
VHVVHDVAVSVTLAVPAELKHREKHGNADGKLRIICLTIGTEW